MEPINLFEYQNKVHLENSFDELEVFLDDIWKNREKSSYYTEELADKIEAQQFLQFLHKTHEIKSNKYVGVIYFEGKRINLLPKILYGPGRTYSDKEIQAIQQHIIWWLSYCRKIKFPNYQTSLGSMKSDFFEVLIYLFSKYTRNLLSSSIYQQYEEIHRELPFIKGRLDTNTYIRENLSKGRWHKLNCTYDAFVFDNQFNRIIKYVANLLFHNTGNQENKKYLREILFILDEVSDVRATAAECAKLAFNPMFGEFETVRDYCYLFLNNSISFDYKNDLKLFAFLLPMEYVFEDFVFGFIDKELPDIRAKAQLGSTYLDTDESFALRPDLVLEIGNRKVIADTKYKIVYTDEHDPKKGISQSDLYQMIAYAIRFKVNEIIVFYPNTISEKEESSYEIQVEDALANGEKIKISVCQLPILNRQLFEMVDKDDSDLDQLFEETKKSLVARFKKCIL